MNPRHTSLACVGWLLIFAVCLGSQSDDSQTASMATARARGVLIEEAVNEEPAFMVRVEVDHANRIYREGEIVHMRVVSEKDGYVYLIYLDAQGTLVRLFPNKYHQDNTIAAGVHMHIPPAEGGFRIRVTEPFGEECLKAIVSRQPLDPDQVAQMAGPGGVKSIGPYDLVDAQGLKGMVVEMKNRPAEWAEHHVVVTTRPRDDAPPATPSNPGGSAAVAGGGGGQPVPPVQPGVPAVQPVSPGAGGGQPAPTAKRVGVFIGISDFQDPSIRDLKVSDRDAGAMADAMEQVCHCQAIRLIGPDATLANIQEAIERRLQQETRPGDEVVIYWSGHGGRCADDNGDERDGFDEYLVPYDGRWGTPQEIKQTMLLDDTFGRWVQGLDGRKVMIILDTCHSGGQSAQAKGLGDLPTATLGAEFDFLDGEMERTKDIGQRETALLASSLASQVSFERKEGDMSVMTYCLINQLRDTSSPSPLTLQAAFENLKRDVAAYVESKFPGTTQTPFLVDNLTPPFYLRP